MTASVGTSTSTSTSASTDTSTNASTEAVEIVAPEGVLTGRERIDDLDARIPRPDRRAY